MIAEDHKHPFGFTLLVELPIIFAQEPLSQSERWLRRYPTSDQVKQERGQRRIVVDSLSENVDALAAKDLAKLLVRFVDLAEELKPLLKQKAEAERKSQAMAETSQRNSQGRSVLNELGLSDLREPDMACRM